jgi:hypothetical protein
MKQPKFKVDGKNTLVLLEDYTATFTPKGVDYGIRITVPEGFISDGASVPRFAWTISGIRPVGLISAAALVHDWLYVKGGVAGPFRLTKKEADYLFYTMCKKAGMNKFKCKMAYWAVRMFGKGNY